MSGRPWIVIGSWVVFAVLVVAFSPKLESTVDQSEFLPDHYESVQGFDRLAVDFPDTNTSIAATVVFDRPDGDPLTEDDLAAANTAMASIKGDLGRTFDGFVTPDPAQPDLVVVPSENSDIAYAQLLLSPDLAGFEPEALDARELRRDVQSTIDGTGLEAGVTGNVASSVDNEDASGNALTIVGIATVTLIVLLLALIFRSVLICLLPVVVVGLVSFVATGLIGAANAAFDLKADASVQQILIVVLYGVPALSKDDGTSYLFSVLLDDKPDSDAAIAVIKDSVRPAAHTAAPPGSEALVTGNTAVFVDFQDAMNRDYSVVFPVAAGVIILILALLLRSLVAPVYLMVSVGLGFGATLGATVLVFQNAMGDSGLIFILPMYIYLFVVALGTDYNILIARLREEAREGLSPRDAAAETVKHGGPTIAAAGVILAGTFASLMLGGNSLLVSMGFAISLGILIAAFVMAMFFTPALTALMGHAAWWPGHGDEKKPEKVESSAV